VPQQFTNCLKTFDHRVPYRARQPHVDGRDLLLDTDIWFGYGMFPRNADAMTSPICGGWGLPFRVLPTAEPGRKDVMVPLWAAIAAIK
jgi:hypothetical protein